MNISSHSDELYFSIVVPTYNRADLIKETLVQIQKQTFTNFEIIVVDDGSTDGSGEVISIIANTDSRIKYYFKENGERAAARNFGLKKASGKYVVFFDSDDIMLEDHLAELHAATIKKPEYNFLATKYSIKRGGQIVDSDISSLAQGKYNYKSFLLGNFLACNICIKKDNKQLIPFVEDRKYAIMEDWMFMLSNLKNDHLYLIDKTTIVMVDHPDRSMANNKLVIERRALATEWIEKHVDLSKDEVRLLKGYSSLFSAIHYYLDYNRYKAILYNWRALMLLGIKKNVMISFVKFILGKKIIDKVKYVF